MVYWFWEALVQSVAKELTHHPNCTRFQLVHQSAHLVCLLAIDSSREAVAGIIRYRHGLLLALERDNDDDGSEYLFLCLNAM